MCTDPETDDTVCNSPLPTQFMASDEPRLSLGSIINPEPDDDGEGEGDIVWQSKIYCPFTHTHTDHRRRSSNYSNAPCLRIYNERVTVWLYCGGVTLQVTGGFPVLHRATTGARRKHRRPLCHFIPSKTGRSDFKKEKKKKQICDHHSSLISRTKTPAAHGVSAVGRMKITLIKHHSCKCARETDEE